HQGMHNIGILVVCLAAIAKASVILTLCPASSGSTVPCLNDTARGTTTNLQPASTNQVYDFSHLNITDIQDLPSEAQYIDLSYNRISSISRDIPPSLIFLYVVSSHVNFGFDTSYCWNLSHNALIPGWFSQTSITVSTLDVSYNQGGLPWMKEIQWRVSFPKLDRLVYRGNNMTSLRFNSSLNLPPERHPFSALDVGDNPNLSIVTLDGESYRFLKNNVTLTTDLLALTLAKRACNRGYIDIPQMQTVPVQYLPRGVAKYDYAKAFKIYVCFGPYEYTSGILLSQTL
ncbi:unnamed protein product, partial [Aphanomyces euteiches]